MLFRSSSEKASPEEKHADGDPVARLADWLKSPTGKTWAYRVALPIIIVLAMRWLNGGNSEHANAQAQQILNAASNVVSIARELGVVP